MINFYCFCLYFLSLSSNARRTKLVDLNQTPHVIHQIHQANPGCCAGQANHSKIQVALRIGHRTKDMFNGSVFGELSRSHSISPDQLVLVIDGNVILVARVVPEPAEGWVSWFFLAQRAWVSF